MSSPFRAFLYEYADFVRETVGLHMYRRGMFSLTKNPKALREEVLKKAMIFVDSEIRLDLIEMKNFFNKVKNRVEKEGKKITDEVNDNILTIIRYFDFDFEFPVYSFNLRNLRFGNEIEVLKTAIQRNEVFPSEIAIPMNFNEVAKRITGVSTNYVTLCKDFYYQSRLMQHYNAILMKLVGDLPQILRDHTLPEEERVDRILFLICADYDRKAKHCIEYITDAAKNIKNCTVASPTRSLQNAERPLEELAELYKDFALKYYHFVIDTIGILTYKRGFFSFGKNPIDVRKSVIDTVTNSKIPEKYEELKGLLSFLIQKIDSVSNVEKKGKKLTNDLNNDLRIIMKYFKEKAGGENPQELDSDFYEKYNILEVKPNMTSADVGKINAEECEYLFENSYKLYSLINLLHYQKITRFGDEHGYYENFINGVGSFEDVRQEMKNFIKEISEYNAKVAERVRIIQVFKKNKEYCSFKTIAAAESESSTREPRVEESDYESSESLRAEPQRVSAGARRAEYTSDDESIVSKAYPVPENDVESNTSTEARV